MSQENKRTAEVTEGQISEKIVGKIGGDFQKLQNPSFIDVRLKMFEEILAKQKAQEQNLNKRKIAVTLLDNKQLEGEAFTTTPFDIAKKISKPLAEKSLVAKVIYSNREKGLEQHIVAVEQEDEHKSNDFELWDMQRPLEGDCTIEFLDFNDPLGKMTFWHSSAHILGLSLEMCYGSYLCFGPPLAQGFFYDSYIGVNSLAIENFNEIQEQAMKICGQGYKFERIILTKEEALKMFSYNPFKCMFIEQKISENAQTTAYRCGPLIDLCTGPHLPNTSYVKAFECTKVASSYWLANAKNDNLQRVYGIAFPSKKEMLEYKNLQEELKRRDHRNIGQEQELFMHDQVSAGCAFFHPNGTIIYNNLMNLIRKQYSFRGFQEVITPNMFNVDLWKTSGHYTQYKENMYLLKIDDLEYGMKPMNCPAHCIMFGSTLRSYKDLPIRMADFGVLHRNEVHGALSGLTRVRRFQQDDAHIFCSSEQIMEEIMSSLDFLNYIYSLFEFEYTLELSTKPDKAIGNPQLWEKAENALQLALDKFGKKWKLNPGDGAFYGPKIDIKLTDALGRQHQCGTIQLDFVLPERFNLQFRKGDTDEKTMESVEENKGIRNGFERPVIIHRAILGSVERMFAVLCEHTGGKWPFWISHRQLIIIPVSEKFDNYCEQEGYNVDQDKTNGSLNKKVRNAQLSQYNYIAVVGDEEEKTKQIDVRCRENNERLGKFSIEGLMELFENLKPQISEKEKELWNKAFQNKNPEFDNLEEKLKNQMFFSEQGQCCGQDDKENFQKIKDIKGNIEISNKSYPNLSKWFKFMDNFLNKQ